MTIDVQPIETNGQFYVEVIIDGTAMERHGPYADADAAESVVGHMSRITRTLTGGGDDRG
jgi:hypothetical protein